MHGNRCARRHAATGQEEQHMKTRSATSLVFAAGVVVLSGCVVEPPFDPPYQSQPSYQSQNQYPSQQYPSNTYPTQNYQQGTYYGTVDRIEVVNRGDSGNVAGMVIGGIVGGLIGSQIGGGNGNTVATVAGVAGGAYAGNQIQQRQRAAHETLRITVRMENGSYQSVTTDNVNDLRTGDRVRVDGNSVSRY
jgi:outer membrane lipoprotein SlyB